MIKQEYLSLLKDCQCLLREMSYQEKWVNCSPDFLNEFNQQKPFPKQTLKPKTAIPPLQKKSNSDPKQTEQNVTLHTQNQPKEPQKATDEISTKNLEQKQPCEKEFYQFFQTQFAHETLIKEIPDDSIAIKIQNQWKETSDEVIILHATTQSEYLNFLSRLNKALLNSKTSCQTKLILEWEKDITIKQTKLLIIEKTAQKISKNLIQKLQYNEGQNLYYYLSTPVILLPDLAEFFKNPQNKLRLWKMIQHLLKK